MPCSETFKILRNLEVTYEEYKTNIEHLKNFLDPAHDCIEEFVLFVENLPHQEPNPQWYTKYLITDVMKIGSKWVYKNQLDLPLVHRLLASSLHNVSILDQAFMFDAWLFIKHLVTKYFEDLSPETQRPVIDGLMKLIIESNFFSYNALEMLVLVMQHSVYKPLDMGIDIPFIIRIAKTEEYLPLSNCVDYLKLLIKDHATISKKEELLHLIETLLVILENNPADDIRLEAVKSLQLLWLNIFPIPPTRDEQASLISLRYRLLEELKQYQANLWVGLVKMEEIEPLFFRFLNGLKDNFSMIRAEISLVIMLLPFDLFSLSHRQQIFEWVFKRSGRNEEDL